MHNRPEVRRRHEYLPQSPQEEFVVPLLRSALEGQLTLLLKPNGQISKIKVLDVGCGFQPFRSKIEASGAAYFSLDVSPQDDCKVDFIARLDDPDLDPRIFSAGPYDVILCSEVLEHIAHWDAVFSNFHRLLAPRGRIIVSCPHFFPLHEEPYDFWRPTPYALRAYADKHGLAIDVEERLGSSWDIIGTILARQVFLSASRSLSDRILSRLLRIAQRVAFRLLRSRFLQRHVRDCGPYYLANFAVLRKAGPLQEISSGPR